VEWACWWYVEHSLALSNYCPEGLKSSMGQGTAQIIPAIAFLRYICADIFDDPLCIIFYVAHPIFVVVKTVS
jgi:hypothetical protein